MSWRRRTLSRRQAIGVLVASTAGAVTTGCGYALAGRGNFLPSYIRTVGILPIENKTTFYRVEQILTERVRAEFIGRGKYKVVPDNNGADALLTAEIASITLQPVALTADQLASRFLFTIVMRAQFTDVRNNEALWSNDQLIFREEYDLGPQTSAAIEGATFLDNEGTSFERISVDIARSVVTAILEAF